MRIPPSYVTLAWQADGRSHKKKKFKIPMHELRVPTRPKDDCTWRNLQTCTLRTEGCGNPLCLCSTRQKRFYDFNVWSEEKLKEKLEYMHANPVQRKLVEHPRDWLWSSWSFYVNGELGFIKIDPME